MIKKIVLFLTMPMLIYCLESTDNGPDNSIHDRVMHEILHRAVQKAIACLEQLQEELVQELLHQWVLGLQEYLEKLLTRDGSCANVVPIV